MQCFEITGWRRIEGVNLMLTLSFVGVSDKIGEKCYSIDHHYKSLSELVSGIMTEN